MSLAAALAAIALLGFAAWRDVATRTIPDGVSIALAGIGLVARALHGLEAAAWSLGAALLLGLLLALLHARGWLGGGDVKLATALAVGLDPLDTWAMVVATALAGGALALVYLILQRLLPAPRGSIRRDNRSLPARLLSAEAWRIRRRGPLPYGVAIAAGGTLIIMQSIAS
ncbi:A24 family peptidase [Falsiroseomonas sp. HW251]|uniref:A24 family peptidase n=1 Tax=Falsiroseomonas sp. HW251 TaxID=3390998 RepID=UPI003D312909